MSYAELLDAGRFVELAALFEHATYRIAHAGTDQLADDATAVMVRM